MESKNWITTSSMTLFCSDDCKAAYTNESNGWFIGCGVIVIMLSALFTLAFPNFLGQTLGIMLLTFLMCLCVIPDYIFGFSHAKNVARNSRENMPSAEQVIVREISTPMNCPNCGGVLNLKKVRHDLIYRCDYCGLSGALDVVLNKE
jgi:predicted RNA-binding Zn-ribbon protein involved in translation (DUF1610 family)